MGFPMCLVSFTLQFRTAPLSCDGSWPEQIRQEDKSSDLVIWCRQGRSLLGKVRYGSISARNAPLSLHMSSNLNMQPSACSVEPNSALLVGRGLKSLELTSYIEELCLSTLVKNDNNDGTLTLSERFSLRLEEIFGSIIPIHLLRYQRTATCRCLELLPYLLVGVLNPVQLVLHIPRESISVLEEPTIGIYKSELVRPNVGSNDPWMKYEAPDDDLDTSGSDIKSSNLDDRLLQVRLKEELSTSGGGGFWT